MNRMLLKVIKVRLEEAKGVWSEELPNARTLTGEMPFKHTYGIEAVIPVEVGVTNMRREAF